MLWNGTKVNYEEMEVLNHLEDIENLFIRKIAK